MLAWLLLVSVNVTIFLSYSFRLCPTGVISNPHAACRHKLALDWRVDDRMLFFSLSLRAGRGIFQILQSDWCRHSLWTTMSFLVFSPLLIFASNSESRPVLKWYCLLYLDFSLHNNWPLFIFFHPASEAITQKWKKIKKKKQKKWKGERVVRKTT